MDTSFFWIALQTSFLLGLIHGVNPCGHSWVVLAPFVVGHSDGKRVFTITAAFLTGTALACVALGVTLGAISHLLPAGARGVLDIIVSAILILLGLGLIINPDILHKHDGECGARTIARGAAPALFTVGFLNMILPCPTVAIMYSYALESKAILQSAWVFAGYAIGTALSVGMVIFGIYKVTNLARRLNQDWIEDTIMRVAGAITLIFGVYSLWNH